MTCDAKPLPGGLGWNPRLTMQLVILRWWQLGGKLQSLRRFAQLKFGRLDLSNLETGIESDRNPPTITTIKQGLRWISPSSSGGWKWRVETLPVLVDVEGEAGANLVEWLMKYSNEKAPPGHGQISVFIPEFSTHLEEGPTKNHLNQWFSGNTLFRNL